MIKSARLVAVALIVLPILAGCGRPKAASTAPSMATIAASRIPLTDISPVLTDAGNWWVNVPTYNVRPLNSATFAEDKRYGVTQGFYHVGTREELSLDFEVYSSSSYVSALFALNKALNGNGSSGPKEGDQVLYYNHKLGGGPAPYVNEAIVQVGQTLINVVWTHVDAYASTNAVGKIAGKAVSRLKDAQARKVKPSAAPQLDSRLLAPLGPDLTLLGSDRLPVEVIPAILFSASPQGIVDDFKKTLGASDFVYGDYALNLDTRMEVLTAGFEFQNPNGADALMSGIFSSSDMLGTGEGLLYDPSTQQYIGGLGQGNRAVLIFCRSTAPDEAASRSCEAPLVHLIQGWRPGLNG